MDLKSQVGVKYGPYAEHVTPERLSAFAAAVGAQDTTEAPPTFLTVCRRGEFELIEKAGVPLSKLLHGEQEYQYYKPIRAGDELLYETQLAQCLEKRGSTSSMQFLIFETLIYLQGGSAGDPVAKSRSTIIVRGGA